MCIESKRRLLEYKFQLCYLLAVWNWENKYPFLCLFHPPKVSVTTGQVLVQLMRGLHELIYLRCVLCVAGI